MNLVILKGNLTGIPELKSIGEHSTSLAIFTIAVNERTKQGDKTHFINCKAFGKTAENIGKYFDKGKPILIQGAINQEQWESEGKKFSRIVVIAIAFDFVGSTQTETKQPKPPANKGTW